MNPTLKETLELSDKKIKEKSSDEKHELELCPEKNLSKIFSWMSKNNNNSTLKYLQLTNIQKKYWTVLLVQTLHYNKMFRQ